MVVVSSDAIDAVKPDLLSVEACYNRVECSLCRSLVCRSLHTVTWLPVGDVEPMMLLHCQCPGWAAGLLYLSLS